MALKTIAVDTLGDVEFQKRRGTRTIRIHIRGSRVRVTLPYYASYHQAVAFVKSRADWILQHKSEQPLLTHGAYIGKQHRLEVVSGDVTNTRTRINNNTVTVKLSGDAAVEDPKVQSKIHNACERALKVECEQLITPRMQDLSLEHDIAFNNLAYKKLRSRWGSCDTHKNITITIYLIQLPWPLIDYVLIHELAHTKHANHSKEFWTYVQNCLPDYKHRRNQIKQYNSGVILS